MGAPSSSYLQGSYSGSQDGVRAALAHIDELGHLVDELGRLPQGIASPGPLLTGTS